MAKMANTLRDLNRLAEESYKKARVFFRMGRYNEALAAYGEADKAWKKMADLLFEKGKEDSGKELLKKVLEVRSCCGMSLFKLGRYEEALKIIDATLEVKPESPTEWSNRGFVLSALGRNEKALEAFEKALSFDPASPKILTSKGIVYFKMELLEKALETFDKALAAEPKQASDWACKLPRFSFFSRNKAPIMRPDNAETWYWKGNVFLELGEKEKALEAYKIALESDPDHLNSLLFGGNLLCKFSEYEEAIKCYARALKLSPGNETAKQGKEFCESKINE
ncbi:MULTISPECIES: tetratricopeptide repeat protein [unclassified Methanosarcina]|uniref:tetratricopeptide repeat protein n=1 Tax=unclassified Methanosarcina TaxID=2644672 RepID=UPI000615F5E1|nr:MULTISPECIES: tetratricopeptide repeat protein [unclassified Methanosarcina]AKB18428.1 GTP cyclohydrolase III (methanopterin) [Methanosarcina sp. WWM596]AKB22021.1 GTP cyclohydrolase III (methanopterin) [Methanosarcina sp. WH1]